MSLGDLYHQLSQRTLWITHEYQGKFALAVIEKFGPRIRQVFDTEDEANKERDRLNALERR